MSEIVIKVENVGKKYMIGHKGTGGYKTLREQMFRHAHNLYSRTKKMVSGQVVVDGDETEEFWALKELNFDVKKGDRVGIIGKNGAGKSTLLKVLSRITEPTTGKISIKGRVASLLEVGTGFHAELTGRENIFLNGAILGMSRAEIKRKFDEIVDFSGIERFLDTPVKRYSSGMYVRLAFSVAAHLEPEILVVDEVLAVGDAEFQKKCLGKMKEVSTSEGRTILFVSHNLMALANICNKGIYLKKGQMRFSGDIEDALLEYTSDSSESLRSEWKGNEGDENMRVYATRVFCEGEKDTIYSHKDIIIEVEGEIINPLYGLILGFWLYSQFDYQLAYTLFDDTDPDPEVKTQMPGKFVKRFVIPANTLAHGGYRIQFDIALHALKYIVQPYTCDLDFYVDNIAGIGRKYVVDSKGFKSLFRPAWSQEKY